MEQQFSLSWKNFHGNLSNGFAGLLDSGEFVDVTLACDGQLLQAHKVVLSICSPYFKRMFQLNPCQHPIVVLRDVSHQAMRNLIHFMYNGEVSIRHEDLASFISTAETLEIKGLTNKHSEEKQEDVPKTPTHVIPLNNNTHSVVDTTADSIELFSDDITRLEQTKKKIELINQLATLKRKSEDFIANNFNNEVPEKRIKVREKQILNRHKIANNYQRGTISVKNFDTKRSDVAPNINMFEHITNDANKNVERNNSHFEPVNQETNGRRITDLVNLIKEEEDECNDLTFEDSLPKSVIQYDRRSESDNQQATPSPRSEQDGALSLVMDQRNLHGSLPVRYHYIFSRKGHKQLVFMNFVYTKHSTSHGKTSWRCVQYFSLNRCPATVETVGAMIYAVNHEHNHENCLEKIIKNMVYEMEDVK